MSGKIEERRAMPGKNVRNAVNSGHSETRLASLQSGLHFSMIRAGFSKLPVTTINILTCTPAFTQGNG